MRMLLTGVGGQVGWELRRTLAPLGELIAVDRRALDLADAAALARAVREARPHLVVNAAAHTAVDRAESEPELANAVNATAPGVLAEECRHLGAALVHYSTDYVFGGDKAGPYTEDDAPAPINVYGASKLRGERAIQAAGARHLILRTSWVYGLRGANFLLTMRRLARERPELRVVDDQTGAPTWCRMIAEATAQLVARGLGTRGGAGLFAEASGVYHLAAGGATTWYGFAREIFAGSEGGPPIVPITTAQHPTPARRPANSRLDCAKLERAFGVRLPAWNESLRRCLEDGAG